LVCCSTLRAVTFCKDATMAKLRVKYVQLEAAAFLSDEDFQMMSDAERGIYCTVIFYLLCNDGRIKNEPEGIKKICNVNGEFEQKWFCVKSKFYQKSTWLRHHRVDFELKIAKKRLQVAKESGVKGAEKRWGGQSNPNGGLIAKVSKGKVSKGKDKCVYFFDNFWKTYPRKDAEQRAVEWFKENQPSEEDVAKMVYTIEQQKKSGERLDCKRKFMPLPTTWLNDGDWRAAPTKTEIEEAKAEKAKKEAQSQAQYNAVVKERQTADRKASEQRKKEIRATDGPAFQKMTTEKLREILDKQIMPLWLTRSWLIKEILAKRK